MTERKSLVQYAIDDAIAKRSHLPSPSPGSTPAAGAPASAHARGLFARIRATFDPSWDPADHPRDLHGRFTRATAAALLVAAAISGVQGTMQLAHDSGEGIGGHGKNVPAEVLHGQDNHPQREHDPPLPHMPDEPVNPSLPSTGHGMHGFDMHVIGDSLPPADLNNVKLVLQRGKDGAPAKVVRVIERQLAAIQEMQASAQAQRAPASDRGVNPSVSPRPGGKVQLSPALQLRSQVTDNRPRGAR